MTNRRFRDKAVKAAYQSMPPPQRQLALQLREIVFNTAAQIPAVGPLNEVLRWQQPSYLTSKTGSGSTVRIDAVKGSKSEIALYFHCQTGLLDEFRQLYASQLHFSGQRAIVFDINENLTEKSISHCIALALTYHNRRRRRD